ncbi:MAG TPA: FtsH protease activity modulator HflK [Stellaceae bacterium]|nr:FtsH protease activity modulator HflK [Stellaceae bacterium]
MIWLSQSGGGGPWGTGPRGGGGGGPWGGGRGNGGGPGPRPGGPQPPNLEELLRRSQDRFRRILPGGFGTGTGLAIVLIAIVVIWLASGFYRVLPDEQGIVLRFGAYNRTTQPGLNYHLPAPIESVLLPSVTRINRTQIGYRSNDGSSGRNTAGTTQVPQEALMLTGDENIVDINFTVFWLIKDAQSYLFNIRDQELTVKSAAESAMREVIGETPIAEALAEGRGKIETETQKLLQQLLNSYYSGIEITQVQLQRVDPPDPVIDAFRDVQRALADRARLRNEAEAYRNDILPRARGDAVKIKQEAEGYRAAVVARAQGDADRFTAVYKAFSAAKDVTLQRLYLETMEDILKNSNKVIIDKAAEGSGGVLPYLPLPSLPGAAPAPPAGNAPAAGGGR